MDRRFPVWRGAWSWSSLPGGDRRRLRTRIVFVGTHFQPGMTCSRELRFDPSPYASALVIGSLRFHIRRPDSDQQRDAGLRGLKKCFRPADAVSRLKRHDEQAAKLPRGGRPWELGSNVGRKERMARIRSIDDDPKVRRSLV